VSEEIQPTPALGEAGETCCECGAPLAADQRYCLNCGHRRGGPRVDFRQHLPAEDSAATNGSTPPATAIGDVSVVDHPYGGSTTGASPEKPQRDYAPLAAVGGIAVLGLMLLVGVLIGRGGGDSVSAPAPIIRVPDGGGGTTAGNEEAAEESGAAAKQAKAKGSGKAAKSAGDLAGSKGGGAPVEASDEALQELQEQSPEEYQESSAKLPDEIATGGAPPPKDSKAPGGGSKGTAIE
jgi:hypothetical protein